MQPEQQWVWVCGVDPGGCWVSPEQLTHGVLDELLRVTAAQSLGGILIDRRDVITLGCTDDGTEGGWWTEDGRCLLFFPAQAFGATYRKEREREKGAALGTNSNNFQNMATVFISCFLSMLFNIKHMCCITTKVQNEKPLHLFTQLPFPGVRFGVATSPVALQRAGAVPNMDFLLFPRSFPLPEPAGDSVDRPVSHKHTRDKEDRSIMLFKLHKSLA